MPLIFLFAVSLAPSQEADLKAQARDALRKASEYFRTRVASHGGYLWFYSPDLSERWGEAKATREQVWVQPPGTPAVGLAYLRVYEATRDRYTLEAARECGEALLFGRLKSGGWTASIDFDPKAKRSGGGRDHSSLDDDITSSAIRFLARLDQALDFKDAKVHEGVGGAIDALLKAQYANGGFPQVWLGPVEARPVLKASYPEGEPPKVKEYWHHYTLNDNLAGRVTETLLAAARIYDRKDCLQAAARLGDFLILAQLPDPQPAWAQQYDAEMHPAWARKFEPPAVTGWESQDVIEALLRIHEATGDAKYLEPVPRALAYLRKSLLSDGRFARFYELKTNRPLYMTEDYRLTYDDANTPRHYGFKQPSRLDAIEADFERVKARKPAPARAVAEAEVRRIIAALDAEGRWIEEVAPKRTLPVGRWILCATFNRNVETLSDYLKP